MTVVNQIKFILEDKLNYQYERLFNETEISSFKIKYEEGIQNIYDEAKGKHVRIPIIYLKMQANIKKQTVPLWAWILILYLGYEDVYKFISSYWIIPLIILLSAYGILSAMGMGHIPKLIINLIKNTLLPKWANMF